MNTSTDLKCNKKATQYVPFYRMTLSEIQSKKYYTMRLIAQPIKMENISTG
jgi:hypothetical protein